MNYGRIKKISSILLIVTGAIALISEIASSQKNYYIQSIGVVLLMLGLFIVNSGLSSKSENVETAKETSEEE